MSHPPIDCTRGDRDELVARYLGGAMSGPEAEAFEEHFFGCEGCWAAVRRGVEVRAAFEEPAGETSLASGSPTPVVPLVRRHAWWPLAAAAAMLIAAVTSWRAVASHRPDTARLDEERGAGAPAVQVRADSGALTVVWSPVRGATGYRVRLFTADGDVLLDREVADTVLASPAAVPTAPPGTRVFWEVDALNGVRDVIARSALTAARVPAAPH